VGSYTHGNKHSVLYKAWKNASYAVQYYLLDMDSIAWSYLLTRLVTYVQRNNKALSVNRCCRGRVINITYFEHVSVFLP
jgi:hypothetical protein